MADSGEITSSFSHDPYPFIMILNCMLLDYCLLDALKREINILCSIYGLRSVCKQLRQSVKVSLNFIRLLRVVFSSQQLLNPTAVNAFQ